MKINNWKDLFDSQTKLEYWKKLQINLIDSSKTNIIYPKKENIFRAFKLTEFKNIKVVIIGQDPYHQPHQAVGLSFSVEKDTKLPPSLINIFKELNNDLGIKRTNGDLSDWAKQGVLLLNSTLTVNYNQANSHSKFGWQIFTDFVIRSISENIDRIVYILWGNNAIEKKNLIDNSNNLILTSAHPSPLSASRGFFNSKPFSKTNNYLEKHNKAKINW